MGAHDARERVLADSQFGGGATAWAPATWYVGLSITVPNEDGTGFVEPPATAGYARVAVANIAANWPPATTAAGETTKANGIKITFPNPTGPWGLCAYVLMFTAASGGTPEYSVQLDAAISPRAGNTTVEFDVGQLVLPWA